MGRWKRILRSVVLVVGVGLAACLALLLVAYGLLQTGAGRAQLARLLANYLSWPGQREVTIRRFDGDVLRRIQLSGVTVQDKKGRWLSFDSATVEWRPLELLTGRIHMTRADLSGLRLARLPVEGDGKTETPELRWPRLPFHIIIDRFSFEDISLGEAVMGVKATFRAVGESTTTDDGIVKARVTVERTDGTPAHAEASALFHARTESLALRLEIDEPQGGVIARALQLSGLPPVSIRLNGDGPLAAWRGRLMAQTGDLALIEVDIDVSRDGAYAVNAHGRADITRLVDAPLRRLFARAVSFTLELSFADAESIRVHQSRFASDAGRLDIDGQFERGQFELDAALTLTPQGMGVVNDLLAPATAEYATISGRLSGPLLEPEVRLELTLTKLSLADVAAGTVRGSFSLRADRPLGASGLKTLIRGQGQIAVLHVGAPKVEAVLGETADWAFDGRIDSDRKRLDVTKLSLSTDRLQVAGSGSINVSKRSAHASIHAEIGDLAVLAPATGIPLHGRATLETRVRADDFPTTLDAMITGEVHDLSLRHSTVDALLGPHVTVAAHVAAAGDGTLKVEDLRIDGKGGTLEGAVTLSPRLREIDGRYHLRNGDLGLLSESLGTPVNGGVTIDGTAHGDPTNPILQGSLALTNVRLRDVDVGSLEGMFTLASVTTEPRGSLSLTVEGPPFGPANASTNFVLAKESRLRLSGLSATTRETRVTGELLVPLSGGPAEGTLSGQAASLGSWSLVAGRALSGIASFDIHLHPDGPRQAADVRVEGNHVTIDLTQGEAAALGHVKASARLVDVAKAPRGNFSIEAQDARWGEARLSSLSLTGDASRLASVTLRVQGTGDLRGPFKLDLAGTVAREPHGLHLTLDRLQANVTGASLLLKQALQITYGPALLHTNELVLDVDDGRIAAQALVNTREISAMLEVKRVPLALTQILWPHAGLTGMVTGHTRIAGLVEAPTGRLEIALTDARSAEWAGELPSLSGALRGEWNNGRLKVAGEFANLPDTRLVLQTEVPLRLAIPTLAIQIPNEEAVSGHLAWRGDLAVVWDLLALGDDRVRGRAELAVDLSGTVGAPQASGQLAVADGEYENFYSGTVVKDIELTGHGNERRIVLTRAIGTDGDSGRFSVHGTLDFDRARNLSLDLTAALQQAVLVRRDELTATATGRITLHGTLNSLLLSGQVETDRVEARIVSLPREVVELDVVEVNKAGVAPGGTLQTNGAEQPSMRLDLSVTMPNRVFIRGRGLDSEWSGNLRITGTTRTPIVAGMLKPVRGVFSFAGKDFKLGDGSVRFDRTEEIDPTLNLSATYSRSDFSATVEIRGSALHPSITLSSQPPLPQSEIVSRILFGRSAGELSAIEAVQLADAIASLSGEGAPNILDFARRTLGVDVFRVEASPDGGEAPTVTIGKYLSDDIYVGVSEGTDPATGSTSVEVQITPNVTLETDVRQDGVSNVGIKWRWDY